MILAITFVIFLAILIITHEFGHFIVAKLFKLRVDEFAFGFPPKLFSKKIGDTKYSLNLIPFGGFVKIYGESAEGDDPNEPPERSFYFQPAWKRALVIVAGVAMNFLVGWLAFSTIFFIVGIPQSVYIDSVVPGSPAANAGFVAGEKIEGFSSGRELISYIDKNAGREISLNGKEIVPRVNPPENEGKLGVKLEEKDFAKYGLLPSLYNGFGSSVDMIVGIFTGLGRIVGGFFTGGSSLNELTGPVGIFQEIDERSSQGILYLVQFLGVLSLNLAVFNMLPVPALDGGRFLFIIFEIIIGRRLNVKYETIANLVGFALLILLAITVTVNDIFKII